MLPHALQNVPANVIDCGEHLVLDKGVHATDNTHRFLSCGYVLCGSDFFASSHTTIPIHTDTFSECLTPC